MNQWIFEIPFEAGDSLFDGHNCHKGFDAKHFPEILCLIMYRSFAVQRDFRGEEGDKLRGHLRVELFHHVGDGLIPLEMSNPSSCFKQSHWPCVGARPCILDGAAQGESVVVPLNCWQRKSSVELVEARARPIRLINLNALVSLSLVEAMRQLTHVS